MPKQPAKTTRQSAKYREQQLRRRMAAQTRAGETLDYEAGGDGAAAVPANGTSTVSYAPATTASPAARPARRPAATPRPGATSAQGGVRNARGRLAAQMQAMNLEEEMGHIRGDVRRLLILATAAFAILIALAFVLPN